MDVGILTTITSPEKRQDKYIEVISNYLDFADQVVVVDGSKELTPLPFQNKKLKQVHLPWPQEWNWIELPRHLNYGLSFLKTSWILKLDIDQLIHEKDFLEVRAALEKCPLSCLLATFQKMTLLPKNKHYQKGGQPIAFRRLPNIVIGENIEKETDLCFPVFQTGVKVIFKEGTREPYYELPFGHDLGERFKTPVSYWNYDYFFKTEEFTKKEFWRFSQAYHRYFNSWRYGDNKENAFKIFIQMQKARFKDAPYTTKLIDHPQYIRQAVKDLTSDSFGFEAWNYF